MESIGRGMSKPYLLRSVEIDELIDSFKTMDELNDFIRKNVKYGLLSDDGTIFNAENDQKGIPLSRTQSPEVTVKRGYGSCIDTASLQKLWCDRHNIEHKVLFIDNIRSENKYRCHVFVVCIIDNNIIWNESSWYKEIGIHRYKNMSDMLTDISMKFGGTHYIDDPSCIEVRDITETVMEYDIKNIEYIHWCRSMPLLEIHYNKSWDIGKTSNVFYDNI